jgi:transcriptional regulator with XRE-family HTH domain
MADPLEQVQAPGWQPGAGAGRVLRLARTAADLDVKQVAAAAGVSRSHLSNLEAGRHRLLPDVAERVARAILSGAQR